MLNEIKNTDTLSNDDLFRLIFEVLDVEEIKNQREADIIVNYLTNNPTPLREAVAYKLENLVMKYPDYFKNEAALDKFLNAISDINPNVSRLMCSLIENNSFLSGMLTCKIIKKIEDLIQKIKNYEIKTGDFFQNKVKNKKNHTKNKLLFSLYWYLEALCYCNTSEYKEKLLKILSYTINICDYTIREKTAKLLNKLENIPVEILQKAKCDQNFYVKIQVYDKITMMIS